VVKLHLSNEIFIGESDIVHFSYSKCIP